MNYFNKDFELRRMMFGLTSIIKTPEAQLSPIVQDKLPEIMNQLSRLAKLEYTQRLDVLKFNKKLLASGGELTEDQLYNDGEEVDVGNTDEYGLEDNDSDEEAYDERGGDMQLYDSRIEEVDAIGTLKETLV